MSKKGKYFNFASQLESKDGKGKYIKVNQDISIPKGSVIFVNTPQENIERLVNAGVISEQEGADRLAKVPSFVLKELTVKFPDDSEN